MYIIKDKLKIYVPIVILSMIFYMMLSTPHSRALGDAVLEEIGLKAWTDGYSGTHLTVIYFGVLFCDVLAISKKFLKVNKDVSKIHRIVVFVAAVIIIYLIHRTAVHKIMENADGLNTIAIAPSGNFYEYTITDDEAENFELEFELINYSRKSKHFSVGGYINNIMYFEIYNKKGEPAKFSVPAKGAGTYKINSNDYVIKVDVHGEMHSMSGSGIIDELLLTDDDGNSTKVIKLRNRGIKAN